MQLKSILWLNQKSLKKDSYASDSMVTSDTGFVKVNSDSGWKAFCA